MLPNFRQRLMILTAVLLGAVGWLLVEPQLVASYGGEGLTLMWSRSGPVRATALMAILGIPALAIGLITSVSGSPLAGVFSVTAALSVLAWRGGSIDGYLYHAADAQATGEALPGAYGTLILEMAIWVVGLVSVLVTIQYLRSPMRSRWPILEFEDHADVDLQFRLPNSPALLAGLICAVVGGVLAFFLLQSSDVGQVVFSLLLAFGIGGFTAQMLCPQSNPVAVLLSPALVAVLAYGWVLGYESQNKVLTAWYSSSPIHRLPGLALALPIHYASAAVAGSTMGVGWARSLDASRVKTTA